MIYLVWLTLYLFFLDILHIILSSMFNFAVSIIKSVKLVQHRSLTT